MRTWVGYPLVLLTLVLGTTVEPPAGGPMDTSLFRNIARRQNPAIVSVMTRSHARPEIDEESPLWLFEDPAPFDGIRRARGSGFLISGDGEILTNNHVVAGADTIDITLFADRTRTYRAAVVGRDPHTDSALLKLQNGPPQLPAVTLGDSNAIEPGDWVMAIGDPYQFEHSVTVGVVSFRGRPFQAEDGHWQHLIQTSVSINPGNSGGPLINVRGEVVGINAAVLADGANDNAGIGFAIPINTIKAVLPQLRSGKVVRGRLGIQYRHDPIAADEAMALDLPAANGVIVAGVEPDSPSSRAAVRAGDVIVAIDGTAIADADDLGEQIAASTPGTRRILTIVNDGRTRAAVVTIGALAVGDDDSFQPAAERGRDFGLTLDDLTPAAAARLRSPQSRVGAVVTNVAADSPADLAGVRKGDIITAIARRSVKSANDARFVLEGVGTGDPVFLLLWRSGREQFVVMRRI